MNEEDALWQSWREGDSAAFERLYVLASPGLHALCRALTPRSGMAPDDLFQETFRRALAPSAPYRSQGSFQAWLATIARHVLVDHLRKRQGRAQALQDRPDPASAAAQRTVDILDQLASLPEEEREAIALRHLQGLSIPEAAGVLEVSEATLKRRIVAGFSRLAKESEKP